jgi:alpha,alpha-trehalose phosphorylase
LNREHIKRIIYPYSAWSITEESFDIDSNLRNETMFSLANGTIGMFFRSRENLPIHAGWG